MKILFDIPKYLPWRDGAIMMVKDYSAALRDGGHEIKVYCIEGRNDGNIEWLYKWSDIVLSHLGRSADAKARAAKNGKPFIWLCHSEQFEIDAPTIFNSQWLAKGRGIVCYPICDYEKFKEQSTGINITLIGLNVNKGGYLLPRLANRMKGHRFIGVAGGYGGQEICQPNNVKVIQHPCYIDAVLKDTKILLIMSEYESFSRCCAEAMSMGIPVISTMTNGVIECAGNAAVYVEDRENINEWAEKIEMVEKDLSKYNTLKRGKELQDLSNEHINRFENLILKTYENKSNKIVQIKR